MNASDGLDQLLRRHYERAADTSTSEAQIADVLRTVASTPQHRGFRWRPTSRPDRHPSRARGPLRLLGLAALLVLGAAMLALAAGSSILRSPEPLPRVYEEVFESVGTLPSAVYGSGLVPLPDGDALLVARGGRDRLVSDDLFRFDAETGTFTGLGALRVGRMEPASVLLQDGRVLIVGSGDETYEGPKPADGYRAELVDPATGRSVLSGPTVERHSYGHSATLLEDGRVLIAGGDGHMGGPAELYDPDSDTFASTAPMSRYRTGHAAVRLHDGRVLIVGGTGGDGGRVTAELFDPATETFTTAGPMAVLQDSGFTASLLDDGRVLVAGGWLADSSITTEAQIFDPETDTFNKTGPLPASRTWHGAATLADGRVLIVGGYEDGSIEDSDSALTFDPDLGTFAPTTPLTARRLGPLLATLVDGRVLVFGSQCLNQGCYGLGDDYAGQQSAEVYR
jgi:hypothetical protein